MPPTPRFLTLADVAEVLSTSSAQVYALVRRGELPAIKIGGRGQWRVGAPQLEDYIPRVYTEARAVVDAPPFTPGGGKGGDPQSRRLPDLGAEGDPQPHLRAPAAHGERDGVAGSVRPDRHDERDPVGDVLAGDVEDHIALAHPSVLGRTPGTDLEDLRLGLVRGVDA